MVLINLSVPSNPGIVPIVFSGNPNMVFSPAMVISAIIASSHPTPKANPLTATIIGFLTSLIL